MAQLSSEQLAAIQEYFRQQRPVRVEPLISGSTLFWCAAGALGIYLAYQAFKPEPVQRRCSECGRTSHTAMSCPYTGPRRAISSSVPKTGWCECCNRRFRRTQHHHYGGRADPYKSKEMCLSCHLHCGHDGDFFNFAINPRYCRLVA